MMIKFKKNIFIITLFFLSFSNATNLSCLGYYGIKIINSSDSVGLIIEGNQIKLPDYILSGNPYTVLGLKREESESNVDFDNRLKKRARKLKMIYHSDRSELILDSMFSSKSDKDLNKERVQELLDQGFRIINEAYDMISSRERRESYNSGFANSYYDNRRSSDPFNGYFDKSEIASYSQIITLELNDRAMTFGNLRPVIDAFREMRSLGLYNRAQLLNMSYRVGFFKTALKKAHQYLEKNSHKGVSEEEYKKAIEYFLFNHLAIFNNKFSFKDYLDLYGYVSHPRVKLALMLSGLEFQQDYKVRFAILNHFITDVSLKNESFFRELNAKEMLRQTGKSPFFEENIRDFLSMWLTDIPGFLKQSKNSMNDAAVLKFLDLMDLEAKDLPMEMLNKLANSSSNKRARDLSRKILKWNESESSLIEKR